MTRKQEFSANDAHPAVLYGKTDPDSIYAYPVLIDASGRIVVSPTSGDKSAATSGSITVGSVSTAVLSSRPDRTELILCNDSDEPIYITFGSTAAMNSGVRLNAYGGSITDEVYTGAVSAISQSGAKNLTVIEL